MKRLFRRFATLIISFILCAGIIMFPNIKEGYQMYESAVALMPIEEKVEQIVTSECYIAVDEISQDFIDTLIETEDRRFYSHIAIDPIALIRAVVTNINQGQYKQGGSTITQQLAKNMYFSFEKRIPRKIAEIFVAMDLEKMYSKDEILSLYCSIIYFGNNCYGLKDASSFYFDKTPIELTNDESVRLVAALKAPSINNPATE